MTYFHRLHFLLILEKALTCISDELDVFRMVSRCDKRRACIVPYNSLVQFEYTTATEIHEVSRPEERREVNALGRGPGGFLKGARLSQMRTVRDRSVCSLG